MKKRQNKKRIFCIGDFLIVGCICLLSAGIAAVYFLVPANTLYCEIQQNGQMIQTIKLAEGYHDFITVKSADGHYNVIEIDGKRVRIQKADCPDHICVKSGWLTHAGQSAACLPHRLIVKIKGNKSGQDDIDAWVQ